uniref:Uncharacterized protein n=1 Tax=Panagrolaimus sp. ES5 TaxID=591445 RepID=A0AC34G5Q7_9BILA
MAESNNDSLISGEIQHLSLSDDHSSKNSTPQEYESSASITSSGAGLDQAEDTVSSLKDKSRERSGNDKQPDDVESPSSTNNNESGSPSEDGTVEQIALPPTILKFSNY